MPSVRSGQTLTENPLKRASADQQTKTAPEPSAQTLPLFNRTHHRGQVFANRDPQKGPGLLRYFLSGMRMNLADEAATGAAATVLFYSLIAIIALLAVFDLALASVSTALITEAAKVFLTEAVVMIGLIFALALMILLRGKFELARDITCNMVIFIVFFSIVLTGGFPTSPAAPLVMIPPTLFFIVYGTRGSAIVGVLIPVLCLAQWALTAFGTYTITIVALVLYAHANSVSKERFEQERIKLAAIAHHDLMTGLPNARYFLQRLDQACARIDRSGGKLLNRDEQEIEQLRERLRKVMAEPIIIKGQHLNISISVGSAVYPNEIAQKSLLLEAADKDMYRAKKQFRQAS
eukprot:gene14107-14226_t